MSLPAFDYSLVPLTPFGGQRRPERAIRLLELAPSDRTVALWCDVRVYDLATAPAYEALSYTWGDPEPSATVHMGAGVMRVRRNLFAALKRLRLAHRPRLLWIDALCVDQADVGERNYTVAFMREIYASARGGVIVWFGEEDPDTWQVQGFLDRVTDGFDSRRIDIETRLGRPTSYAPPPLTHPGYAALYRLLLTPWSSRVWIVQEIVMAPADPEIRILKGGCTFRMEQIARALTVIYHYDLEPALGYSYPARFATIWVERDRARTRPPLLDILVRNWLTYATDPRDKVWALLGLSREHALVVDYDASYTVERVFTDLARHCIAKDRDLTLLSALSSSKDRMRTLPSWVPDWTTWNPKTFLLLPDHSTGRVRRFDHFQAAGSASTAAWVRFPDTDPRQIQREMQLEGHVVAEISHVSMATLPHASSVPQTLVFLAECAWIAGSLSHLAEDPRERRLLGSPAAVAATLQEAYPRGGGSVLEACYAALTMDGVVHWRPTDQPGSTDRARRRRTMYADFHAATQTLREQAHGNVALADPNLLQRWRTLYTSIGMPAAVNRRFVRTRDNDLLGLFCEHVKPGDQIVLLKGAKVPFAIRRSTKPTPPGGNAMWDKEMWEIVGDGYLHGVMYGAAWNRQHCQTFRFL